MEVPPTVRRAGASALQQSEVGNGGAEGIRTLDPHVANVVLSQLSYCPTKSGRRILPAVSVGYKGRPQEAGETGRNE